MKTYTAPWSTALKVVSVIVTLVCLGVTLGLTCFPNSKPSGPLAMWLRWLPVALVVACALFTVRGYTITADAILVHRLFWDTRLSRAGLQSARFEPQSMCKSIRTCGNGGFYSFTGWYWNKTLGSYRAFVTDPRRAVVLRYERRTLIVSPDEPERFIQELKA